MNGSLLLPRVKWILFACLLGLFITGLIFSPAVNARAGSDSDPQLSHPLLQATDYPIDTLIPTDDPYPAGTPTETVEPTSTVESMTAEPSATQSTATAELPTASATITMTPTDTGTPPPNTFQTEDSEMGGSLVTPPSSETPAPTSILTATQSLTPAASKTHTVLVESAEKQNPFQVNWGMFWMGFALPVVASCGFVLYLLDRRPDLFRPKHK